MTKFYIVILILFLGFNITKNKGINNIINILDAKNMRHFITINSFYSFKNKWNNTVKTKTITFWLKIFNNVKDIIKYTLLSLYDNNYEYDLEYLLEKDCFNLKVNEKNLNLKQQNDTWAYYIMELEFKQEILVLSMFIYNNKKEFKTSKILNFENLIDFEDINISIGNNKNNTIDHFTGYIYYLNIYDGNLNSIEDKISSSFQEPKIIYFIDFLDFPSNTQIFLNKIKTYSYSTNGSKPYSNDFYDINNLLHSDYTSHITNDFIINNQYQYISLDKELLNNDNKYFNQKSILLKFKILAYKKYNKISLLPLELYLYKRIGEDKENKLSLSININNFYLDQNNKMSKIFYNILLKNKNIISNIEFQNIITNDFQIIQIEYLILTIIKNPIYDDNLYLNLICGNNKYTNIIKNNLFYNDLHYIGNPNFNINNQNELNKYIIITIRIYEFVFLNGGDIINDNNSNYKEYRGRNEKGFVFTCKSKFYIERKFDFMSCVIKNINTCKNIVINCEICEDMICLYCKNNYILNGNMCIQINNDKIFDVLNKFSINSNNYNLVKINDTTLESSNSINYLNNKLIIFKLNLPTPLSNSFKFKNILIDKEFSNFNESNNNNTYQFTLIKNYIDFKKLNINIIFENTSLPSNINQFNFNISTNNLLIKQIDIQCNNSFKSINFPCYLCSNKFKIINNKNYSICIQKCPNNHYIRDYICIPCQKNVLKCNSYRLNNYSVCKKGYSLNNNICIKCNSNCKTCNFNIHYCSSCKLRYYLIKNNYGFGICNKCNINCRTCNNSKENSCLSCNKDKILYKGQCLDKCPDYTFKSNQICSNCAENCIFCKNKNICNNCNKGYFLKKNNGKFWCKKCSKACSNCNISQNNCINCANNYSFDKVTNMCTMNCPDDNFINLKTRNECINCKFCKYCYINNTINCLKCDKCSKNCKLFINLKNKNTIELIPRDFTIDYLKFNYGIQVYNTTDQTNIILKKTITIDKYINKFWKKITLKLKNKDFNKLTVIFNDNIVKSSKNCLFSQKTVNYDLNSYNKFINFISNFFKFTNLFIYFLAILFAIYWESLSNKLFIQYRLIQFFKFYLLLNLNLSVKLKIFFIDSNSDNLIYYNTINSKIMKIFNMYSYKYFDYEPSLIINLDIMLVKIYIVLILICTVITIRWIRYLNKKNKIENINSIKLKKNCKLKFYENLIIKVVLIMIRLDNVNIFFTSLILFKFFLYFDVNTYYILFIYSLLFWFIFSFGFYYLIKSIIWIEDKRYNNLYRLRIIRLYYNISMNKEIFEYKLNLIDEIKYLVWILNLLIFKKFSFIQIYLCLIYELLFYLFLINNLKSNSVKFILYFISETLILWLFFPLLLLIYFKNNKFFDYLIILMIVWVYIMKMLIIFNFLISKFYINRKKILSKIKRKNIKVINKNIIERRLNTLKEIKLVKKNKSKIKILAKKERKFSI